MPKQVNVRVTTVDAELEFAIQSNTTGKQLFDQVTKTVGLRETWYFGLSFKDSNNMTAWLSMDKKLSSQDIKKESPMKFRFRVRFYPEDVAEELIQDITRHMFYMQVKEAIVSDDVFCPPETCVLLASYMTQAKFGDYDEKEHKKGFLSAEKLLPQRVLTQYSIDKDQWEERITTWFAEHKGMHREDAQMEYLKIAQDLEMYGVSYFDIRNKKGTELLLGVDALGINIYEKSDRLTPKIGFPWSEIRNVSFSSKKFVIKPIDKKAPDFVFYTNKMLINKRILELCMGNHELYMRRRKQDSIDVQQMKQQAKEEREARQAERLLLIKEKQEREEAERKRKELEEQLNRYSVDFEKAKKELEESQLQARSLEERMELAERERRELEEAQRRAEEARREAEEAANLEKADRENREREAAEAQLLLQQKLDEAREKEEETYRLQQELEDARIQMEENQRALEQAREEARIATTPPVVTVVHEAPLAASNVYENYEESDNVYETVKSASSASSKATSKTDSRRSSRSGQEEEVIPPPFTAEESISVEEEGPGSEPETPQTESHEFLGFENGADIPHPEEDRQTQAEKNLRLQQQLQSLTKELEASKVQSAVTHNDVIYRQNVAQGRDKYKTLKQIRQGNTKHRVDIFEAM